MKTRLLSILLLTAAFPLAAAAQDTPTGSGNTGSEASQSDTGNTGALDSMGTTGKASGNAGGDATDPSASTSAEQPGAGPGASPSPDMFVTLPGSGTWRVADLQGKTVYSADGSNIGDINDVILSQNGGVGTVIIGVGGFLGIGEKNVAVNVSSLQVAPGAMSGPTAATGTESDDSETGPGSNTAGPDRLFLNVTRAQLEAAPAYTVGMSTP